MEDSTVVNYRLNEQKFNTRVLEFRESTDLATLRDELALCKSLIEDRLNFTNTPAERAACLPTIRDLLNTLSKLASAHRTHEIESGELLTKDALRRFANEVIQIIVGELSGLTGWEEIVERVGSRLSQAVENANNKTPETVKLGN